jgi:CubicO group peptidase (beta-lactamase class C family)
MNINFAVALPCAPQRIPPMKRLSFALLLVALAAQAGPVAAKPPHVPQSGLPTAKPQDVGLSATKLAEIEPTVKKFVAGGKVAGVVTIVARKGKVVHFSAVGKRDIAGEKPMTRDTIFRFYSMSKPITSVALMMLVEEGRLNLDDPVSKHLPEFKGGQVFVKAGKEGPLLEPQKREFTIRDLLRHTAGLTYGIMGNTEVDTLYRKAGVLSPKDDTKTLVGKLGKLPLAYQPGTRWMYSVGVDVQGRLIEVKSGKSLGEFFRERIFEPLGMRDTAFYVPKVKLARFATNYGPAGEGKLKVVDDPKTSAFARKPTFESGGGGLVSTGPDYIRFCQMLLNGGELDGRRLLKAETVKQMTKNQLPKEAYPISFGVIKRPGIGFGLGFSVVVEKSLLFPSAHVGEYGWGGAASTHFWISPKDDLAVVVLTQHMPFSLQMELAVKPIVYRAIEK